MMKRICINCKNSKFRSYDNYGGNVGLHCKYVGMRIGTLTKNMDCFILDTENNIEKKQKENPFKEVIKNNNDLYNCKNIRL